MVKTTGDKAVSGRLKRMGSAASHRRRMQALYAIGQKIELDAEISITAGSVSGKGHVPSRPGEPPNADTRQLDGSIHTVFAGADTVHVIADAPHAVAQEFGTSKMEERPYMRPAVEKNRDSGRRYLARVHASTVTDG